MDIQAIVSLESVLHYIAKYASKGKSKSKALKEFVREVVRNGKKNDSVIKIIQKYCFVCAVNETIQHKKLFLF